MRRYQLHIRERAFDLVLFVFLLACCIFLARACMVIP
jgi:hypothetical protein